MGTEKENVLAVVRICKQPEQGSCYMTTVTEQIERAETSCEINGYFVSDIETACRV